MGVQHQRDQNVDVSFFYQVWNKTYLKGWNEESRGLLLRPLTGKEPDMNVCLA